MKRFHVIRTDRIASATLHRLAECHQRVEVRAASAWDGIDLTDLLHDLLLARAQRDHYRKIVEGQCEPK